MQINNKQIQLNIWKFNKTKCVFNQTRRSETISINIPEAHWEASNGTKHHSKSHVRARGSVAKTCGRICWLGWCTGGAKHSYAWILNGARCWRMTGWMLSMSLAFFVRNSWFSFEDLLQINQSGGLCASEVKGPHGCYITYSWYDITWYI